MAWRPGVGMGVEGGATMGMGVEGIAEGCWGSERIPGGKEEDIQRFETCGRRGLCAGRRRRRSGETKHKSYILDGVRLSTKRVH